MPSPSPSPNGRRNYEHPLGDSRTDSGASGAGRVYCDGVGMSINIIRSYYDRSITKTWKYPVVCSRRC